MSFASLKDPTTRRSRRAADQLPGLHRGPADPAAWGTTAEEARSGAYRKSPGYRDTKERFACAMLAAADRIFPGLSGTVVYREVSTPLSHTRFTRSTGGSGYGLALVRRKRSTAARARATPVRGLLVCGASQRFGHGILGAMLNGTAAAAEVAGRDLLAEVVRGLASELVERDWPPPPRAPASCGRRSRAGYSPDHAQAAHHHQRQQEPNTIWCTKKIRRAPPSSRRNATCAHGSPARSPGPGSCTA